MNYPVLPLCSTGGTIPLNALTTPQESTYNLFQPDEWKYDACSAVLPLSR